MKNLYAKTMLSLIAVVAVMGLLLFIPAGKIRYWQAWVYLAIYIGVSLLFSTYLFRNDPALLERRIKGGPTAEKRTTQKIAMLFASLGFVALLVVPALNYRFAGSSVNRLQWNLRPTCWCSSASTSSSWSFGKTRSPRRRSEFLKTRKSFRPDRMRWCVIPCTQARCCM